MEQYRSLILRGNRALGAYLAERTIISDEDFAKANERLMELLQNGQLKQASLINILCHELKCVAESALVEHLVEDHSIGLVDLTHVKVKPLANDLKFDYDMCWASGTLPFESLDGVVCVATINFLSKPIVKHWEDLLKKPIFWYGTSVLSFTQALERLTEQVAAAAEAEAKAAAAKAELTAKMTASKPAS